jgi:hypothetical protein
MEVEIGTYWILKNLKSDKYNNLPVMISKKISQTDEITCRYGVKILSGESKNKIIS